MDRIDVLLCCTQWTSQASHSSISSGEQLCEAFHSSIISAKKLCEARHSRIISTKKLCEACHSSISTPKELRTDLRAMEVRSVSLTWLYSIFINSVNIIELFNSFQFVDRILAALSRMKFWNFINSRQHYMSRALSPTAIRCTKSLLCTKLLYQTERYTSNMTLILIRTWSSLISQQHLFLILACMINIDCFQW